MEKEVLSRIKNKYDTLENWERNNPVLLKGEIAFVTKNFDIDFTSHVVQIGSVKDNNVYEFDYIKENVDKSAVRCVNKEVEDKIIKEMISNPNVTRKQLSKIIGLSDAGIKYHLGELTKDGIIAHKGATKKGYWVVIDNKEKKEK